jgi:hypothetical protein
MLRCSIAIATIAFFTNTASAWNSIGHMTISKLAYDRLDAKSQLALFKLLKSHPHYKDYLAAGRPDVSEAEWVVMRSSVWPDWIRPRKKDKRDVSRFHRSEEHYRNIAFVDPKDEKAFEGKQLIDPDIPNIVDALKIRGNVLKMKSASAEDRAIAACWLFHLIGDIHQPLHNATYFSSDPNFRTGDLGGNTFAIKASGKVWRLHTFWDDLLGVDRDYGDDSADHQAALYREALKVAGGLRGLKLNDADQADFNKNATYDSWSREGFEWAKKVSYRKGDGSGLLPAVYYKFNGSAPEAVEEVGEQYIRNARALAERRAVMAGMRLADRVQKLLAQ